MKCTYNNVYLYNGDCRNVFKGIDGESVDLLVTDCPYKTISGGVKTPKGGIFLTREACIQTGRKFIGIEIDPEYYNIAENRLSVSITTLKEN